MNIMTCYSQSGTKAGGGWVRFFLEAVAEVSREATETARHIVGLRENHRTVDYRKLWTGYG